MLLPMLKRIAFLAVVTAVAGAAYFCLPRTGTNPHASEQEESSHALEAMLFRARQRITPGKIMPPDALWRAKLQREAMTARQRRLSPGIKWSWLGPGNIGGRIRSIVVDPDDVNHVLVGAVSGGIWNTTDGGANWAPVDDFLANLCVNTMARHPSFHNILYAGTGEGFTSFDEFSCPQGGGIFKSTDNGATWKLLPSTQSIPFIDTRFLFVNRVQVNSAGTVFAATNESLMKSDDGGSTWTELVTEKCRQVLVHPTDPQKLLVEVDIERDNQFVETDVKWSHDGGQSFIDAGWPGPVPTLGPGRIELAQCRSNPLVVYASVSNAETKPTGTRGLYRSDNGGQSFKQVNSDALLGEQGEYANAVWVDPMDPDIVIVGGLDLYRSIDGGTSFTRISNEKLCPSSAHADQHVIVESSDYNGFDKTNVFFGNDGGIYRAPSRTVKEDDGWVYLNNKLGITQFYGAAVSSSGVIYGGAQDNGELKSGSNSEDWGRVPNTGDGGFTQCDPADSNLVYGEYVCGDVWRSTNAGASYTEIISGLPDEVTREHHFNFISPLVLDPHERKRLYLGGIRLWVCDPTEAHPAWFTLKKPTVDKIRISAIAVHPNNSDILMVGHNDGRLFRSKNVTAGPGSATWKQLGSGVLPSRWCSSIVMVGEKDVYATFMGYEKDNVWKSTDGGNTWKSIGIGLPEVSVSSIAVAWGNHLIVGTDVGTFDSYDDGTHWTAAKDGLANVPIDQLIWESPNSLLAVTYGRGIYRASISQPGQTVNLTGPDSDMPQEIADNENMHPSMSADGRYIAFNSIGGPLRAQVYVYDLQTRSVTLVSKSSSGEPANQGVTTSLSYYGYASRPIISSNGRYVVFGSTSTNLDPADTDGKNDIYIHDLVTGTTKVASTRAAGGPKTRSVSQPCGVTPDGKFVLFAGGSYVYPNDNQLGADAGLYLKNMDTGHLQWVTEATSSTAAAHGRAADGSMSDNAQQIVFSAFGGYAGGDYSGLGYGFGVYTTGRAGGAYTFWTGGVRDDSGYSEGDYLARSNMDVKISADGKTVIYTSVRGSADYPSTEYHIPNIFIGSFLSGSGSLLPEDDKRSVYDSYLAGVPSYDGRYILYSHLKVVDGHFAGNSLMLRDQKTGQVTNISSTPFKPDGEASYGSYGGYAVSRDASVVVFGSYDKLVENDTDYSSDLYVRR
jgi:Tol biopolymer transport system component/photosystem II stability/assembly factor-like uncharacterized protein